MGLSQNDVCGTGSLPQGSVSWCVSGVCFGVCFEGLFWESVSPKSNFPALLEVAYPQKIQTHSHVLYIIYILYIYILNIHNPSLRFPSPLFPQPLANVMTLQTLSLAACLCIFVCSMFMHTVVGTVPAPSNLKHAGNTWKGCKTACDMSFLAHVYPYVSMSF